MTTSTMPPDVTAAAPLTSNKRIEFRTLHRNMTLVVTIARGDTETLRVALYLKNRQKLRPKMCAFAVAGIQDCYINCDPDSDSADMWIGHASFEIRPEDAGPIAAALNIRLKKMSGEVRS